MQGFPGMQEMHASWTTSPVQSPGMGAPSTETFLVARIHIEELEASGRLSSACEVGERVLLLASPAELAASDTHQLREILAIASTLASLSHHVSDQERLYTTLVALLSAAAAVDDSHTLTCVAALKQAISPSESDLSDFCAVILRAAESDEGGSGVGLRLFRAVQPLIDEVLALVLVDATAFGSAICSALADRNEVRRSEALELVCRVLLAAPIALCGRLAPILSTASLFDTLALQQFSLAALADLAFSLADAPNDGVCAAQLEGAVERLSAALYSPDIAQQRIAALGLAKLVLHSARVGPNADSEDGASCEDSGGGDGAGGAPSTDTREWGALLHECFDIESIIADLAFRYTSCEDEEAGRAPTMKEEAAASTQLMGSMLACFEALAEQKVGVSNTVVWIVLGAAEAGDIVRSESDGQESGGACEMAALRVAGPNEHTLRCTGFLSSLLCRSADGAQTMADIVRAIRTNVHAQHGLLLDEGTVWRWLGCRRAGPFVCG